jgi:hypothetical protein
MCLLDLIHLMTTSLTIYNYLVACLVEFISNFSDSLGVWIEGCFEIDLGVSCS